MSFKLTDIREIARNPVQQVKPTKNIVHDLILMGFACILFITEKKGYENIGVDVFMPSLIAFLPTEGGLIRCALYCSILYLIMRAKIFPVNISCRSKVFGSPRMRYL